MWHLKRSVQTDDIHDDDDDEDNDDDEDEDREEFKNHLDKNGDGKLDREDIKAWIIPDDYDHVDEETKHLIRESDVNEVCVLHNSHHTVTGCVGCQGCDLVTGCVGCKGRDLVTGCVGGKGRDLVTGCVFVGRDGL